MRRRGMAWVGWLALGMAARLWAADTAATPVAATGPLTLQQCLRLALARHPDVASAQAALQRAQAQTIIAASPLYPQVGLTWSGRVNQSVGQPVNIGGGVIQVQAQRSTQRNLDGTVNWTFFQSGRGDQVNQSKTQAAAAVYDLANAQQQLLYQVQNGYYQLLAAQQALTVAMKAVAGSERHLDLVQARLDQGQVPDSDLLPIKTEVARARLGGVQAETTLGVADAALRALLVMPPGPALELADELPSEVVTTELPQLLAQAEAQRPDLAAQKLSLRAAQLSTRVAATQAGVTLSGSGTAAYGRYTTTQGESWSVQVAADYPLFDAGASRAQVTVARASEEQSRQQLARTRLQIQQDVESSSLQARQTRTAVEVAGTARQEATSSLAAAEVRYREGLAIIIEVTDAQLALVQAELAEVQARYDHARALAALALAVGNSPVPVEGDSR